LAAFLHFFISILHFTNGGTGLLAEGLGPLVGLPDGRGPLVGRLSRMHFLKAFWHCFLFSLSFPAALMHFTLSFLHLTKKGGLDGRGLPDGRGLLASSSAAGFGFLVGFPDGRGPLVGRLSRRHFLNALRHCHFSLSPAAALMHFTLSFLHLTTKGGLDGRGPPDGRGLLASSSAAGLGLLVGLPDGRGPLVGRLSRRHFQKALPHCLLFSLSSPAALMHFTLSFLHLTKKGGLVGRGLPDGRGPVGRGLLASSSAAGLGLLVGLPDGRGLPVGRLSRMHFQKANLQRKIFFISPAAALMHFAASLLHLTTKGGLVGRGPVGRGRPPLHFL